MKNDNDFKNIDNRNKINNKQIKPKSLDTNNIKINTHNIKTINSITNLNVNDKIKKITIKDPNPEIKNKIAEIEKELYKFKLIDFGTQEITGFKLKQSVLSSNGSVYSDLIEVKAE